MKALVGLTFVLLPCMLSAQDSGPQLLLIVKERLRPDTANEYAIIESEIAATCVRLKCPHPYLALLSRTTPIEVWWLNAFASKAHKTRVEEAYARNDSLMAALESLSERKRPLAEDPVSILASWRRDLSRHSFRVTGARFFVVIEQAAITQTGAGAVFEAEGHHFVFVPAATRAEAESHALRGGSDARVFEVQPAWSLPSAAWVRADQQFWAASPAARLQTGSKRL